MPSPQLDTVKQLMDQSKMLSEQERAEWASLLPFMNDKQLTDLAGILRGRENGGASTPASAVNPAPTTTDKAVGIAPVTPPPVAPPAAPAAPIAVPPAVSSFLDKFRPKPAEPASAPKESSTEPRTSSVGENMDIGAPATAKPASPLPTTPATPPIPEKKDTPPIPPQAEKPVAPAPEAKPTAAPVSSAPAASAPDLAPIKPDWPAQSELNTIEDVEHLSVATMRGMGVESVEGDLKKLAGSLGYFSVQFAVEHSPLYQTYLAVGTKILQEHQDFEAAQAALEKAGLPYLNKTEFEEVNDLLRHMKSAA